jgi:hypothetical protein
MPRGVPGSTPLCSLPSCTRPNCAKGLCRTHYMRHSRGLPLDNPIRGPAGPTKRRSHAPSLDARRLPGPRTSVRAACTMSASALVARWMHRGAEHVELHRCRARSQDVIARHAS